MERGVQKLELTEKRRVHLRAGSEINLTSAGKHNKRTSFRQSLAVCTERAQVGPVSSTCWVFMFTCPFSRNVLVVMVFMLFPWDISAGPGRFPEPSAATDSLSQNLPETSTLSPVHRTRESLPEEEGQSQSHIISVSCYCQNKPSVRPLVIFDRSNDHMSKCSSWMMVQKEQNMMSCADIKVSLLAGVGNQSIYLTANIQSASPSSDSLWPGGPMLLKIQV